MTKITTKGQVTIPKRLRDHLGLEPGSSVEFELAADGRGFLQTQRRAPAGRVSRRGRTPHPRHDNRRADGSDPRRGRGLILVDTNVLLDLVTDDPVWATWSQKQLDLASARDQLAINDVVYAKLSIGYSRMEQLDAMISSAGL